MTPLERGAIEVTIGTLGFYRDLGLTVANHLKYDKREAVVKVMKAIHDDGGNQAAATIEVLERLLLLK